MVTHPTVVVGTGQAGINVMTEIHNTVNENNDQDQFKFIAIDTDKNTLNNAPAEAHNIRLSIDKAYLKEDKEQYPYLTRNMRVEGTGAKRQRSVGRYKLDRRGVGGYDDVFSSLTEEISGHYSEVDVQLRPDQASFNIFFIHSLGGGTGSGTYPLILSILSEIADEELQQEDEEVYLAGIGVVPEITFDPERADPPGDSHDYYPNTYAALSDLKQFTDLHTNDADKLELNILSRSFSLGDSGNLSDEEYNKFRFTNVPFNDYWLVGVDESKIKGSMGGNPGPETYQEELNKTIAKSLYTITQIKQSAENWSDATPYIGTFQQAEIMVPHEQVESLVELKQEKADDINRLENGIPDEIEQHKSRKQELESLKRELDPHSYIDDEDLIDDITGYVEDKGFRGGEYIVEKKSPAEIESLLDEVEQQHSIEGIIIAVDEILSQLKDERGAESVEVDWKDTVQKLWQKYDLQAKKEYGGGGVKTIEGKAGVAEDYFSDKIDEMAEIKEEWDPTVFERMQDAAPPFLGVLESDREYAQRWLDILQDDYSDLERVIGEWNRVNKMKEALDNRRSNVRVDIDDRLDEINGEITKLQNEKDDLKEKVRGIEGDIEGLTNDLTNEKVSERLAILPIKEDKIDNIDQYTLENELTSLSGYLSNGFVAEDKLRYALNDRLKFCAAWDEDIISRDTSRTDESENFQPSNDMWFLFHEDNQDFKDSISETPTSSVFSGSSFLKYHSDPYRIEYVAYSRKGPLSSYKIYQHYDDLAIDGWLRKYANQYSHYLQAFAYLEWYDRDVEEAYGIQSRIRVPHPPELREDQIDKPELSEGELKNFIINPGIDTYLWQGNMWESYEYGNEVFRGWKERLRRNNITYTDIQQATPKPRHKSEWLAGQRSWEQLLGEYQNNLLDMTGTKLVFEEESD